MGKTNWVRVFLGGVVAGVVFIVLGMIARMTYLGKVWGPAYENLGLSTRATAGIIILSFIMWIVLGILSVWLYSAVRPRYGAGVKTAVMAGVFIWVIREMFPDIQMGVVGLFPVNTLVVDGLTNLVSCIVGTIIGAWIYKEHHSPD
jgi:hypothetical protein